MRAELCSEGVVRMLSGGREMQGRNVEPAGDLLFFAAENAAGLLFFPANGLGYPSLITDPSTQHFPKVELTPLGKSTSISAQSISSVQREKYTFCAAPLKIHRFVPHQGGKDGAFLGEHLFQILD